MKIMKNRKRIPAVLCLAVLMLIQPAVAARVFASENVPVTIDISVTYIVNGNPDIAGGDTFTLEPDEPGAPMPEGSSGGKKTITIGREGSFSFGEIHYERPEVYWYTITRNLTEKKGVKKDDSIYRAKVIALNDGHGYVLVYKEGSDEKHELVYTDQTAPATGDHNSLLIWSGIALASASALAVWSACRRRGRKKEVKAGMLALLLMLIMAFPSFAASEAADAEVTEGEAAVYTEEADEEAADAEGEEETDARDIEEPETGTGTPKEITDEPEQKENVTRTEENKKESAEGSVKAPSAAMPAPLASNGERVSYTGSKEGSAAGETTVFRVISDGTSYTGTCAKQGVSMSSSGQATLTKIANSTKIAKVIYHYAIELGDNSWWTGSHRTDKVGTLLGMSSDNATNVTKQRMIEAFCQMHNMGDSVWYSTITNPNSGGWAADTARRVREYYLNINTSNINVPEGFEIWYADAGNAQPFIIWAYTPAGYVTMTKVSGAESITG